MTPIAALAAAAALAAPAPPPATPAAPALADTTGWASTYVDRPEAPVAEGMMWLVAGCREKASALTGRDLPGASTNCDALPISAVEGRRLVGLGVMAAPVTWCEPQAPSKDHRPPWFRALSARLAVDSKGAAWAPTVKDYAGHLAGLAAGWTAHELKGVNGACPDADRAKALAELDAWLRKDVQAATAP